MERNKIHKGLRHNVYNLFAEDKTIDEIVEITGAERIYVEDKIKEFNKILMSSS